MIADMISIQELNQIVTELFINRRRLNISTVFIAQFYFATSNDVRLKCTHLFYYEYPKQMTASTNCISSSDIDFKEFLNFFEKYTAKPYYFLCLILLLLQIIFHISEIVF